MLHCASHLSQCELMLISEKLNIALHETSIQEHNTTIQFASLNAL